MHPAETHNDFSFFAGTRQHNEYDVESVCHSLNDDDRAMLTLYTERQESLKASTTQQLVGKKCKEARQHETAGAQALLDNELFDLVGARNSTSETG